jgi:hypothetical protein
MGDSIRPAFITVSCPLIFDAGEKIQTFQEQNNAKNVFHGSGRGGFVVNGYGAKCAGPVI